VRAADQGGPHRHEAGQPAHRRPHEVDDDLLAGFEHAGRRRTELRGFFAVTLAGSLFAWDLGFTLGAYHTVFYWRMLQLFVVSLVLLLGAVALRGALAIRPWLPPLLGVPVVWFVFRLLRPGDRHGLYHAVDVTLIGLTVLCLPVTMLALVRILAPEYFALSSNRLRGTAVAIILLVAGVGTLVGQFNNHVLTCHDFLIAGDDTPGNCRPPPSPTP
jgi:hypothetical protein